jgi:hypothetical protein
MNLRHLTSYIVVPAKAASQACRSEYGRVAARVRKLPLVCNVCKRVLRVSTDEPR